MKGFRLILGTTALLTWYFSWRVFNVDPADAWYQLGLGEHYSQVQAVSLVLGSILGPITFGLLMFRRGSVTRTVVMLLAALLVINMLIGYESGTWGSPYLLFFIGDAIVFLAAASTMCYLMVERSFTRRNSRTR